MWDSIWINGHLATLRVGRLGNFRGPWNYIERPPFLL